MFDGLYKLFIVMNGGWLIVAIPTSWKITTICSFVYVEAPRCFPTWTLARRSQRSMAMSPRKGADPCAVAMRQVVVDSWLIGGEYVVNIWG